MSQLRFKFERRRARVRHQLRKKVNSKRLRLSIHRTSKHIYAQIIDDTAGRTLVSASTLDKDLGSSLKSGGNKTAAAAVGQLIAERAVKVGVKQVVFDRGGFLYHGRIRALAESAREKGLVF